MPRNILLALAISAAAITPAPSRADPTAVCHCFKDRAFDPERPAAADPYILATTRSSLLSAAFGVEKRSLVGAVMTGTAAEDLWVAQYAGARTGRPAADLLSAKQDRGGWGSALSGLTGLDTAFSTALAGGADARVLAALVVDEVLVSRLHVSRTTLKALHGTGATPEERILASVLAVHLSAPTVPLVIDIRSKKATWGQVLRDAGLTPRDMDAVVRRMVG